MLFLEEIKVTNKTALRKKNGRKEITLKPSDKSIKNGIASNVLGGCGLDL